MRSHQWSSRTVENLQRLYSQQEDKPSAIVKDCLSRAARLEPQLNAFITLLSEQALYAAERLERYHDLALPLYGIPVAVKDLIDVAGELTTCGSRAASTAPAYEDAIVVERLKRAGGVIIGKTNLLEYAYGAVHPEVGDTRNPWDIERTSGGSSGGSAAAVAAAICPLALGTDTGGSIRIPASYCGVVGHKPTYGMVPMDGVMPLSQSLDHVGPLAASCRDARIALAVLADEPALLEVGDVPLSQVRFGVLENYMKRIELQDGVAKTFETFLATLEAAGSHLVEVCIAGLDDANEALLQILYPEASVIHEQNIKLRAELYGLATRAQLEQGFMAKATDYVKARNFQRQFIQQVRSTFDEVDFLVMPTAPWVAPQEDPAVTETEGAAEMHYTGPFNLSGSPAVSIPWGCTSDLPVGIQIVADHYHDGLLLTLGESLEALAPALGVSFINEHQID